MSNLEAQHYERRMWDKAISALLRGVFGIGSVVLAILLPATIDTSVTSVLLSSLFGVMGLISGHESLQEYRAYSVSRDILSDIRREERQITRQPERAAHIEAPEQTAPTATRWQEYVSVRKESADIARMH